MPRRKRKILLDVGGIKPIFLREDKNVTVTNVTDYAEADDWLRTNSADCLVIAFKESNAEWIKNISGRIKIVLVDADRETARTLGATAFVPRTVNESVRANLYHITEAVEEVLGVPRRNRIFAIMERFVSSGMAEKIARDPKEQFFGSDHQFSTREAWAEVGLSETQSFLVDQAPAASAPVRSIPPPPRSR